MLFVLNRDFQILGLASNDSEDTLHYYGDILHTELTSGVSTYEFTVPKNHADSQHIQEGNYITFKNSKGKQLLFTIMEMEEDSQEKVVYCEDIGLDLLNETVAPVVSETIQPATYYLNHAIADSGWEIGVNEIAHLSRTLNFDSTTSALKRVLSILSAFDDAEVDFTVEFSGNTVTHQYINIYKRVGKETGIRLDAGIDLVEARRTVSMEGLATALQGMGKDIPNDNPDLPDTITDITSIVYDDGRYFSELGDTLVRDREANLKWSRYRNGQAQWQGYIVDIYEYDTDSPQELFNRTLSQLQKRNEPAVTYEIDINKIDTDLSIGDTVTVVDSEFKPALYLQARVLSINESETDDSKNSIKLGNYVLLKSSIDSQLKDLQATLKEVRLSWFEQNQPILTIRSTNGEAFLNNVVNTTITATITRGGIDTNSAYQESDFVWTKKDRLGNTVGGWSRIGKALAITVTDVVDKSTFICTVGGIVEQTTIFNTDTTIRATTAPVSPQQGQLWLDTSATPNIQKIYLSGQWKLVTPVSGEEFTEVKDLATVNMQGIASVNTEVAKKVDTTTYTSKVSAIESALANKLETAVANATKLAQDAEIAKKVAQTVYDTKVAELQTSIGSKLDTATANATKVIQDAAIATKVAQTAYDAKIVELNAALATKLNTITANATNSAQDAEIAKRVAQTAYDAKVIELNAAIGAKLDTATATTNKLAQDAEIAKKVAQTDYDTKVSAIESTLATKLNTAIADATKVAQDAEIAKKVALTTYNTKVGELDTAISGHTTRISATETGLLAKASTVDVDALKTRMTTAETSLTTNANEIALKASQVDLNAIDGRLDTAESSLVVQAGQIASKVAQTTFDAANVRLGTAETTITQQATSIASKVATTTYNAGIALKENAVVKATTAPAHVSGLLWLNTSVTPNVLNRSTGTAWVKVTPTTASEVGAYSSAEGSALGTRVTTAESTIVQQGNSIALKAAQTDLDNATGRLTTAEGTLVVQAGQIASKVATTDFNAVESRLDTAESSITQQSGEIASKVATTTYNSGIALKEDSITKATVAPAHMNGRLWLDTSVTPNILNRSTGTAWVKITPTTASEVGAYSSSAGATLAGKVTTAESTIVQQGNAIALKASQADLNTATGRITTAESALTVQAGQIATKVAQTDFNAVEGRLDTAESSIVQQAGEIATKVAQSTFDTANTRLGTAESTISQQATLIASKVAQTDFDTAKGRLDTAEATLTVQAGQIATKVATATYTSGLALKEEAIVKATTAPAHLLGKLWLNTSVTPNALSRSTGTAWVKVTPTTASEVGAYSSTDGSTLAGRVTTAESTIVQSSNAIALKASQADLNAIDGRLDTAEASLTVQAGQIASKVAQTTFDAVNTRLGTAESTITQQATSIASKVATTTYDAGIALKENTIVKATVAPTHVNGLLWLNTAVTPNVLNRSTGTAWVKVTPTTAAEVGAYSGTDGSALAGRVTTAESTIVQQGNSIALKASQTDLNTATGRLTTAEGTLVVQAGQIATKVAQTDFNAVNTRLGTAESTITQQAGEIATKVATTTYNTGIAAKEDSITKATTAPAHLNGRLWLNTSLTPNVLNRSTGTAWVKVTPTTAAEVGAYSTSEGSALGTRVTTAETTIVQQGNAIALKATQTDLDSAKTRLTTAEGTLTVQAGQIASKVATTDFDAVNTRLGTAESTITQQATSIASKVSQTDFNAVNTRLGTAESSIVQQATDITSKVATTTYNAGIALKENAVVKATTAPAHVSGLLWLNTAVTPNVLNRSTGTAWVKATPTTAAEVGAYSSTEGSTLAGRVTTAESTIVQQGNSIALKAAQTDLTAATGRLTTAEGTLVVQAGQIATKVAQTDFNAVNTRLGTAESSITQQATDITTKVATTTYNAGIALKEDSIVKATTAPAHLNGKLWLNTSVTPNVLNRSTGSAWVKVTPTTASEVGAYSTTEGSTLAGRVTTAESTIVQQGNSIALKATQTDLDAAKTRLTTAEGTLTVQAGQIASKVAQTDFNAVNTRLGTAESTIVQQATSIASKVAQADFNAVNTRLGTAESTIVQQATDITSKVATTTYNTGIAAKEDSIVKATTAPAHLSGKLWLNTSLTPNVLNRSTGSAWVKVTPTTAAEVGAYTSTDGSALAGRVTTAESTIVQQAGQITSKVAQTTYDTKVGQLDTAIGTKANASDLSALTTRVTSAETTISQSTTAINLRATKTEAQTYATTAQTAAISTAATDATSKANAALASAQTYTDGINLSLGARVTSAESAITANAITNTVMGTTTFNAKLSEYATEEALGGYATTGALDGVKGTAEAARDAIADLDLTPYIKTTQVEQLEDSINTRISQSGGVNGLRNSIGWQGTDFWTIVTGTPKTIQTPQLETFGFGSGWYKQHALTATRVNQTVSLPVAGTYTLSFKMNKSTETVVAGKYSACGIYVDSLPFYGKGTGSGLTSGFENFSYTFTTTKPTVDISIVIGELAEATISGVMLNLGDKPLQWSSHETEVYNTNVRMDINGIQVMGNKTGSKTVITPNEFSGYEDGEKIFTLNGDTTEVKKLKAEQQFEMAPITIVTIDNGTYKGWAFI
jgi:phage minor structural protein